MSDDPQLTEVLGMLGRERLAIDCCDGKRTAFLSHVGAAPKLTPGPWIAHRDLVYALALANLSPTQRRSLARAALVEHGREFGVGRLTLRAEASGLPMGGSSLLLRSRRGGPRCLHTWALADEGATPLPCEWLALGAAPEWACAVGPRPTSARGLSTLVELGARIVIAVDTAVTAAQVGAALRGALPIAAHPRFSPHLEGCVREASVTLWPHDSLVGTGLARAEVNTVVLVAAPEALREAVGAWARGRAGVEVHEARCPGRADRSAIERFWRSCGRPKVLLRGEPEWVSEGGAWLETLGATVAAHPRSTQLALL